MVSLRRLSFGLLRISIGLTLALGLIAGGTIWLVRQPVSGSYPVTLDERADPARLRDHVTVLCETMFPRNSDHPDVLDAAARYVAEELANHRARVREQPFRVGRAVYRNVVAELGPTHGPLLVIGAHYDVFSELPGADDNASGVAALIELARLLGDAELPVTVQLVAYTLEEPPFFASEDMGSAHHARALVETRRELLGMISLEMIGYYSEQQRWGSWVLELMYPDRGDFVMVVGRPRDRRLARHVKKAIRGASSIDVVSAIFPRVAGVDASDHRSFWDQGFTAVMLTDTAYLRNPNYHTREDLPSSLDYGMLAEVVEGVAGVALNAGRLAGPSR